ncbi:MAG: hypothetical protein A2X87_05970 [Deltaproteobacteria bacterium GWC2_42_51]|nr:MAG: hypothetical protein A2056_04780 [Deltaproteobacteria bacterium GWA2_42_85]OGP30211.1 MAG: hypothetical protein A2067_08410 [Deltaproteobacteria bacterium GWB2_42_7]OGP31440.1 MAG: hypothetical protein A2X87_05970 [Deltaproteobacteria bacterium GWC2_42_51]OGP44468.1 MAG: hypothetical protein A2090_09470 [Deltaproteobacteria bacterium GWD2_42_10]OGP47791.1 MAG: hypothetical protein A2022_06395 [Deltaproteobacteria bacterium GWF2_42_12]OGQ24520.1 MAG: hypothetical protein A3D29_06555 [De
MISGETVAGNMPVKDKNILGQVYRCSICGAELSVIKGGRGQLKPICCNKEMAALETINSVYVCSVCHSEFMVIRGGDNLEPICCNKKMSPVRSLLR